MMLGFLADRARASRITSGVKEVTSKLRPKTPWEMAGVALATNMARLEFQDTGFPQAVFQWPDRVPSAGRAFGELAATNAYCRKAALDMHKIFASTPWLDRNSAKIVLDHYLNLQIGVEILQLTVGCGITPKLRFEVRPLWIKISWSSWGKEVGRYLDDLQDAMMKTSDALDTKTDVNAFIEAMRERSKSIEMEFFPDFLVI